jgi:hypothetical protein
MDDGQFDRSIRFGAFLLGGVLFLAFGIEDLVSGVVTLVVQCYANSFGQTCSGNVLWEVAAPAVGGAVLVLFGIFFFVLAYRTRRTASVPTAPTP